MRLVLDTNVRISSLHSPKGVCARLMLGLQKEHFVQLISGPLVDELRSTLSDKFGWSAARTQAAVAASSLFTQWIEPRTEVNLCRDPDDNRVLECALTEKPVSSSRATQIF